MNKRRQTSFPRCNGALMVLLQRLAQFTGGREMRKTRLLQNQHLHHRPKSKHRRRDLSSRSHRPHRILSQLVSSSGLVRHQPQTCDQSRSRLRRPALTHPTPRQTRRHNDLHPHSLRHTALPHHRPRPCSALTSHPRLTSSNQAQAACPQIPHNTRHVQIQQTTAIRLQSKSTRSQTPQT